MGPLLDGPKGRLNQIGYKFPHLHNNMPGIDYITLINIYERRYDGLIRGCSIGNAVCDTLRIVTSFVDSNIICEG